MPTNHDWYFAKNAIVENSAPLRPSEITKTGRIQARQAKPDVSTAENRARRSFNGTTSRSSFPPQTHAFPDQATPSIMKRDTVVVVRAVAMPRVATMKQQVGQRAKQDYPEQGEIPLSHRANGQYANQGGRQNPRLPRFPHSGSLPVGLSSLLPAPRSCAPLLRGLTFSSSRRRWPFFVEEEKTRESIPLPGRPDSAHKDITRVCRSDPASPSTDTRRSAPASPCPPRRGATRGSGTSSGRGCRRGRRPRILHQA